MSIHFEDQTAHQQPPDALPTLREVCLVGQASGHYRHVALPEDLRAGDAGTGRSLRPRAVASDPGAG